MARVLVADLVAQLYSGKIDRREFIKRATAVGLTAGLVGNALARYDTVVAQEKASDIGHPGMTHSTDTSKGSIKIYSSWPLTGSMQGIGTDAVEAVKMAFEDFGLAAGGFAIDYEALDDGIAANNGGWDAAVESDNANKAVNDADCMVYMATYNSGAAKIAIPILNSVQPGGMAMISYANTYPGLTKAIADATEEGEPDKYYPSGKRNYMRSVPADDIQGSAAANWAYNKQSRKKAYVLHDKSLYGQGVATIFRNTFETLGGEILGFEGYDKDVEDYQSLMTGIADKGPDILYLGATVDNNPAKVLQDMRGVMAVDDVLFLGPDGLISAAFIEGAGDAAEGGYVTFAGFPPSELKGPGADYTTRITERIGHSPDSYAVYGYECAVVVIQAIDQVAEKDRTKILDTMFKTAEFTSLLGGSWSFTETGDTDSVKMTVSLITGGDFKFQEEIVSA